MGAHFIIGSNVTDLDMTFLRCSLAWDVSGAVYGASGSLQVSSDVGSCQRVDSMPANRTTDPVHYNWTSIVCALSSFRALDQLMETT
jgi:hypothetical protein